MTGARGEGWLVDLEPIRGREQGGQRPAVILSVDLFNEGPAGLVVALPITSRQKKIPFHVPLHPPEGGLKTVSYVKCEDIRSISSERLLKKWGTIEAASLAQIEDRLRILLGL